MLKITNKINVHTNILYKQINKHISFKKVEINESNYYQTLGVSIDSDYDEIKQAYYKYAKKYHPDINPSPEALEKFKIIKKAYEVLGDPNLRITYDIENRFCEEGSNRRQYDEKYTNKYGKRIFRGPRTVKNFYYDKWSNFKAPKWSNLNTGHDIKSEYIFRDSSDNMDMPYKFNKIQKILIKNRIIIYFILVFSLDLFLFFDNWYLYQNYKMLRSLFK